MTWRCAPPVLLKCITTTSQVVGFEKSTTYFVVVITVNQLCLNLQTFKHH